MSDADAAAAAASKDDAPDDTVVASTAGEKRKPSESSSDEEDDDDKGKLDESSSDDDNGGWDDRCICELWKGDNPMCLEPGHKELRKFASQMKLAPLGWQKGKPVTPPRSTNDASTASASNVIDVDNSDSEKRNLAAVFEDAAKAEDMVDAMLKAAGVSSFDTYPRTMEYASKYAYACYMAKYSHLKPVVATPNTKDANVTATKKSSSSKKSAKKITASKKKKLKRSSTAPSAKAASKVDSAANKVICVDGQDSLVYQGVKLSKPTASKKAPVWNYYAVFPISHPQMKDYSVCVLCLRKGKETKIACKNGSTGGMRTHLSRCHTAEFDEMEGTGTGAFKICKTTLQPSIDGIFKKKPKEKTANELREEYVNGVTMFIMAKSLPLSLVNCPEFRKLFSIFHKDAEQVTKINQDKVRDNIFHYGKLAERALKIEVEKYTVSWTTDHWTGKDGSTYQTITCHYIDDEWKLRNCMIQFKVFSGSTRGELIYEDCQKVLKEYSKNSSMDKVKVGVTDTTGNMGVLGANLRQNDSEHAYCFDHNIQRNAILSFDGE